MIVFVKILDTLSSEQIGTYVLKLFSRMKDEIEIILIQKNNINQLIQIKSFKNWRVKNWFLNLSNLIQNAIY